MRESEEEQTSLIGTLLSDRVFLGESQRKRKSIVMGNDSSKSDTKLSLSNKSLKPLGERILKGNGKRGVLTAGQITGIVFGVILLIAVLAAIFIIVEVCKRRRRARYEQH